MARSDELAFAAKFDQLKISVADLRSINNGTCENPKAVLCGNSPMEGDSEYLKILDELRELHLKKSADYGSDEDALANVRAAKDIDIHPAVGSWIRAKDKVHRIDRHFKKNKLVNESVQDSLLDLASYCIITLRLLREDTKAV